MAVMTQKALGDALIKLLSKKPLSRITVNDIVEECGLARQTFYYHFKDIYDLLDWTIETGASEALKKEECLNGKERLNVILSAAQKNKKAFHNIYISIGREPLENYFERQIYEMYFEQIKSAYANTNVPPKEAEFLVSFYTKGLTCLLLDWIRDGMKLSAKEFTSKLDLLFKKELILPICKEAEERLKR